MSEIRCPKCGEIFTIDEAGYAAIVKQVHDAEFDKEIGRREDEFLQDKENSIQLALAKLEAEKNELISELKQKLFGFENEKALEIEKERALSAQKLSSLEQEIQQLNYKLNSNAQKYQSEKEQAMLEKEKQIQELKNELIVEENKRALNEKSIEDNYKILLKLKDEEIAHYKDFKSRQSTKMIGESLEQHCEIEFNKLRSTAFQNAYFEKDNDVKTGSKGDYIYRESSPSGTEFVSIMFEMKNQMDSTSQNIKMKIFSKSLIKTVKKKIVSMQC